MKVLYLSEVQWLSQISRKHQLVRRFPESWRVLFLSPANLNAGENSFVTRSDAVRPGVRYASLPLPKPDSGSALLRGLTRILSGIGGDTFLRRAASFGPDVAVFSYIYGAPFVSRLRESGVPVVYDCNDLHPEFYPARAAEAREMFRRLVDTADEVVASSRTLAGVCGRGVVIGNGVDLDTFRGRRSAPLPRGAAATSAGTRSPLVIYVGSVDERIDFEIVESTAEALAAREPAAGMIFVGRVFDPVRERCEAIEKRFRDTVLFAGRAPYEELPGYMANADVGIAPFVLNERTSAINPNKLYMYAAMDLNVVSTPFSNDVSDHADAIFSAEGPDAFASSVIAALDDRDRRALIRERIALPNSWDERALAFTGLLERVAARR